MGEIERTARWELHSRAHMGTLIIFKGDNGSSAHSGGYEWMGSWSAGWIIEPNPDRYKPDTFFLRSASTNKYLSCHPDFYSVGLSTNRLAWEVIRFITPGGESPVQLDHSTRRQVAIFFTAARRYMNSSPEVGNCLGSAEHAKEWELFDLIPHDNTLTHAAHALPEVDISDLTSASTIPGGLDQVISLHPSVQRTLERVAVALHRFRAVALCNHGVSQALVHDIQACICRVMNTKPPGSKQGDFLEQYKKSQVEAVDIYEQATKHICKWVAFGCVVHQRVSAPTSNGLNGDAGKRFVNGNNSFMNCIGYKGLGFRFMPTTDDERRTLNWDHLEWPTVRHADGSALTLLSVSTSGLEVCLAGNDHFVAVDLPQGALLLFNSRALTIASDGFYNELCHRVSPPRTDRASIQYFYKGGLPDAKTGGC
mmetsp:Transcript_4380/g.6213  ORF Transcript_4380/g.6213 Transcript_4380/m.6213 type:complete len:424 (+) Transcript_4380:109-1380(+)